MQQLIGRAVWRQTRLLIDTNKFLMCLDDYFIKQHILTPTWANAVLDLLLLSTEPGLISDVRVIDRLEESDHGMMAWSTQFYVKRQEWTTSRLAYWSRLESRCVTHYI